MAAVTPRVIFESQDESGYYRIVRVQLDPKRRENESDTGIRDLIEIADGKDLLGHWRWKQLDTKAEGVASFSRICHALKRELISRLELQDAEN